MQGHVDVAGVTGQTWTHPPFAGELVDGWVWGRGTLDCKGVAMMISAMLRDRAQNLQPPGDVAFVALADEEQAAPASGCEFGLGKTSSRRKGERR